MESTTTKTIKIIGTKGAYITYGELLEFIGEISKDSPPKDTRIYVSESKVHPMEQGNTTCSLSITINKD